MKKALFILLILLTLSLSTFLGYTIFKRNNPPQEVKENEQTNIEPQPTEQPKEEPETITYNEKPARDGVQYFEKIEKYKGEYIYYAYPLTILKDTPPILIIYSHGSNTTVSTNLKDQFMKDMQMYGEFFTKSGYAFSASSMHGANWGSSQSVSDMDDMKNYIKSKYLLSEKLNLLGFSMGGLPTFNYLFKYPRNINCVALLAPTSRDYTKAQYTSIKNIPIQIWHGDKDVNVPLYLSQSVFNTNKSFGYTNINLEIQKGKSHFDIDTELKSKVIDFFNAHK